MTYEIQKLYTLENSTAGNWDEVAAALSAPITQAGIKASSKRTLGALVAAKYDPDIIIAAFMSTPSGAALIAKLNADPDGIDWSDPLTAYIVDKIVSTGKVTTDVAALLHGLSAHTTTLAGGVAVTAKQCQADWAQGVRAERVQGWKQRFDAALNTIGTVEAADGVTAVLAIAKEMESAE